VLWEVVLSNLDHEGRAFSSALPFCRLFQAISISPFGCRRTCLVDCEEDSAMVREGWKRKLWERGEAVASTEEDELETHSV
jgi:hypothetical protein